MRTPDQDRWVERVLGVGIPAGSRRGPFVALQMARLDWDSARKDARAELARLETAILRRVAGKPFMDEVTRSTHRLYAAFETLDDSLLDRLDAALSAPTETERQRLQREAAAIAGRFRAFVETDPLLVAVDNNPFEKITAAARLRQTLQALEQQLG
jgi:hypothetical protein